MPASTLLAAPARARPMQEAKLAAAAPRLVAQPALWAELDLPRADARSADAAPWSAYWATLLDPTLEPAQALRERTDSCVVPAAGVVGEAMVAYVLADAYRRKFGGDHIDDVIGALERYRERIGWQTAPAPTS